MRIALSADDTAELVDAVRAHLQGGGHDVVEPISVGTATRLG